MSKKLMEILERFYFDTLDEHQYNGIEFVKCHTITQAHDQIIELWKEEEKICPICYQRRFNNQMGYSNQHPQAMDGVEI